MRILELAGLVRVLSRREFVFKKLSKIDKALILVYAYIPVVYLLRSGEGASYIIGIAVDAILCYFTFRGLIVGMEQFQLFLWDLVIFLGSFAVLVVLERKTSHNFFQFLGAVPGGTMVREGQARAFGSFRNPSLLGTVGATFLPLYIGLIFTRPQRTRAWLGIIFCVAIVWASNSGGPMTTAGFAVLGWFFWRLRTRMQLVRRGIVVALILLALVMKAPVWYLLARISDVTGGDGWHRSYLIDVTVQHLGQWWLAGIPIEDTSSWFQDSLVETGAADITNQFISFGLTAGIGALGLFIFLLVQGFKSIGKALDIVRQNSTYSEGTEFFLWGLGVMLVAHIANWLGITYFDQTYVLWFMQLAAITNLSRSIIENPSQDSPVQVVDEKTGALHEITV